MYTRSQKKHQGDRTNGIRSRIFFWTNGDETGKGLNTFQKKIAVSKTNEFLEFFAVVFGEFIDVLLVIT